MNNPFFNIEKEKLAIAHRQWIRANRVKKYYEFTLTKVDKEATQDMVRFYLSDAGIFMFLWYSLLFSVIEILENANINLSTLDKDFSALKSELRKSRNSIFHGVNTYWDKRQFDLISQPHAGQRIRQIHDALGEYFLEVMKK